MNKGLSCMKNTEMHCKGCGIKLQNSNKDLIGYAPKLTNKNCMNCFQLINYGIDTNQILPVKLPVIHDDSVIFIVCSVMYLDLLFNFNESIEHQNSKIVFIINQIDLLPSDTNLDRLLKQITKFAKKSKVNYYDIVLMSALNHFDLNNFYEYVDSFTEKHIYLIGLQNSGKSTIFKAITKNEEVLTLKKAGLTQQTITSPYKDKMIYDTPGLIQKGYITNFYSYDIYKKILPDRKIKPKVYNLKQNKTIIIAGLASISLLEDSGTIVFYGNNFLPINQGSYPKSVDNMVENKNYLYSFDEYQEKLFDLRKNIKYRITLADFGFVIIEGVNKVSITTHPQLHVSIIKEYLK